MKIVEVEKKHYALAFDDARNPGCGYSFPCDKDGNILWDECSSPKAAHKSLDYCKAHPDRWTSQSRDGRVVAIINRERYGICPYCEHKIIFDATGICAFGQGLGYVGAYECECGHWYTAAGQEVLPPDEWEYSEDEF